MSTGYHTPTTLSAPIRLTKDTLLQTQKHRAMDVCPKPEAFAGYVRLILFIDFFFFFGLALIFLFVCRVILFFVLIFFLCDVVFSCTAVWVHMPRTVPIIQCRGRTARCNQLAVIRMLEQNQILCH